MEDEFAIKDFSNSEIINELEDRNFSTSEIGRIGEIFDLEEKQDISEFDTDDLLCELSTRDVDEYQSEIRDLLNTDDTIDVGDTVFGNGLWNEEISDEIHRLFDLYPSDKLLTILENIK